MNAAAGPGPGAGKNGGGSGKKKNAAAAAGGGSGADESVYKGTVLLPKTSFSLRANASTREPEIQQYWREKDVYGRMLRAARDAGAAPFVLHDGPPYANGDLHIGHALNKVLKDVLNKYHALRGRAVDYVPGWDCHGLPIELKVLQGMKRDERAALTPAALRRRARDFALDAVRSQSEQFQRYGVWGRFDAPYMTLQPEYEAAQVRVFGKMVLNGHIYRGRKPVHWSPSSQTALAEAELEYPEGHTSRSIYAALPIVSASPALAAILDGKDACLAVWTTTPWTMPANAAVAVNARLDYSIVQCAADGRVLVVAQELISALQEKLGMELTEVAPPLKGADIEGSTYAHPLPTEASGQTCPVVIGGEYITTASGTGLVHTAPGHGQDDYVVGQRLGLPLLSPVDDRGRFTAEAGAQFEGLSVLADGNEAVIRALEEGGILLKEEAYGHKYPYDWRTKKPTIFRATEQWFASVEGFRADALEAIDNVRWLPEVGRNRIRGMTEDRGDWCISRQRTWGVPIPVFYHVSTGEPLLTAETIDHVQGVFAEHGSDAWFDMDTADLLPESMRADADSYVRGTDTMDVWFDSGTSWAGVVGQREGLRLPADLYLEGSDQHRGWFQSSLLTSVAATGESPYKMVLTHGFVLDERGTKMSKSLGNVVDPRVIIDGGKNAKAEPPYGADVLRLWVSSVDYTSDVLIGKNIIKQVAESYRKLRGTLRFILGNLSDFDPNEHAVDPESLPSLDRYMLGRLRAVLAELDDGFQSFQLYRFSQALQNFVVNELSTFYLDIAKDRLYIAGADSPNRRQCQTVLYTILVGLLPAIAPVVPHLAEDTFLHIPFELPVSSSTSLSPEAAVSVFQIGGLGSEVAAARAAPVHDDEVRYWKALRLLRDEVNKGLEVARTEKMIGSGLDASVSLYVGDASFRDQLTHMAGTANTQDTGAVNDVDRLDKVFIVSQVDVAESADAIRAMAGDGTSISEVASSDTEGIGAVCVAVRRAAGGKCERCWHFANTVGLNSAHPTLCTRCVRVVEGATPMLSAAV